MRMSREKMYGRLLAEDATFNGRFFTGVLTTGIYCLPSCKARKPKPDNVRFFPDCAAARAAGLRPCKKCHPDDFERGADPVLETIEALVAELRREPGRFATVQALARRSGFGATRFVELLRQHYHATPAELLLRARLSWVRGRLRAGEASLAGLAAEAGFESLSTFHEQFRQNTGLSPGEYRGLRDGEPFSLRLPEGYSLAYLRRAFSRDAESPSQRWNAEEQVLELLLPLRAGVVPVSIQVSDTQVTVRPGAGAIAEVHGRVAGMLGLEQNAAGFARLARKLGFQRLVEGREGLRISLTPSVFEGLVWSIIGQQINFAFACTLKARLTALCNPAQADGLVPPPSAAQIAGLTAEQLQPLQFSRQKAEYLIAVAKLVATGSLDLDALAEVSATRAERTLLAIRGLGPWSVNYVMMRALGFADCLPLGDTGVTSGLQALCRLEERPDADTTRRLMSPFSPYRSLATAHLWQFLQAAPQ